MKSLKQNIHNRIFLNIKKHLFSFDKFLKSNLNITSENYCLHQKTFIKHVRRQHYLFKFQLAIINMG